MENLLVNIFEFIYNNLITVAIIVTSLTLVSVTLRLVYLEYRFNQRLSVKKIFFGERRTFKVRRFTFRRIVALFMAVLLIGLIIFRAYGNPISYQTNTLTLTRQSEAVNVYEDFYGKFFSNPFSTDLQIPLEENVAFKDVQAVSFEGFDFMAESDSHVYILNQTGIQTLIKDREGLSYQGSTIIDNPSCEIERAEPQGMSLIDDSLVVVSIRSLGQCVTNPAPYSLRDTETIIQIYDTSGPLRLEESFAVRGHLTNLSVQASDVVLSTNTWIPFATNGFDIEDYLPYVVEDDRERVTLLQNIPYIERSSPNAFVTIAKVDLESRIIDSASVLTDYQNAVHFRHDAAIVTVDHVNFNQASDVFEFRNPVDSFDTSVIQFNHFDDDVYYFRTQVVEGEQVPGNALFFVEEGVKVWTQDDAGIPRIHFFNEMLRYDLEKTLEFRSTIERVVFKQGYFYVNTDAEALNHFTYQDFANGETVQVANTNAGFFGDRYVELDISRHLALTYFDNNRLNYEIYDYFSGSSLYNLSYLIRADYTRLDLEINEDIQPAFGYVSDASLLLIPTYRLTDDDTVNPFNRLIEGYRLIGTTPQKETLNMASLGAFSAPFTYRVLELEDRLAHFTPGGFIITDADDIEALQKTVFFPNP